MPYFNDGSTVWGNIGKGLSDKIQKLQNRAARILTLSKYETRSSILLDELGWESLETKDLNNWLRVCIKSVIIFSHRTRGVFLQKPQIYTSTILETPR